MMTKKISFYSKLRILTVSMITLGLLFFYIALLGSYQSDKAPFYFHLIIIGFIIGLPIFTFKQIKNSNKFNKSSLKLLGYDLNALKLISENVVVLFVFVISILVTTIFLYGEVYQSNFCLNKLSIFIGEGGLLASLYIFFICFVCCVINTFSLIVIAEILQRKYFKAKRGLIADIVLSLLFSLPYILILSVFSSVFLILSVFDNSKSSSIKGFGVLAILKVIKLWVYYKIAAISLFDLTSRSETPLDSKGRNIYLDSPYALYFYSGASLFVLTFFICGFLLFLDVWFFNIPLKIYFIIIWVCFNTVMLFQQLAVLDLLIKKKRS